MKLTKKDIGGELISIITKGMYADPKDALREYVQNGVDANAENITIKVRHNSIVVTDDGTGMSSTVMRRAIRVGISDKNPSKSVGFMGIGLYSSFHLCDTLSIYSKVEGELPNKLVFHFKRMRDFLDNQKEIRISKNKKPQDQIDLQTLLETNIDFLEVKEEGFPTTGTRVEIQGLEPNFFKSLSKFDEISEYLERVIPLPFSPEFSHGKIIQQTIDKVCKQHRTVFRIINLFLDINSIENQLFRPYKDSDFKSKTDSKNKPLKPQFYDMKSSEGFLGIAWGCLNSGRDMIPNGQVRGFIIKKQGFTIGKRSDLLTHFKRQTFFNRYVGEFLVLHPKLLPNAPRSDFEYSSLRTSFYGEVKNIATKFNEFANDHQEYTKAEEELAEAIDKHNEIQSQLGFFEYNSDKLLDYFQILTNLIISLQRRVTAKRFKNAKEKDAISILKQVSTLRNEVKKLIDTKRKKKKTKSQASKNVVKKLLQPSTKQEEPKPESLEELIYSIGFEIPDELKEIITLIDEKFIKDHSENKVDYQSKLSELRNDIEEILESE